MDALARASYVDSARRFETDLSEAIDRVGARHKLRRGWLNDAAASFWPSGASYDDCETVYHHSSLIVRAPAPDIIFVMKLYRADPQDREDLVILWPRCHFAGPDDAAARSATHTRTHQKTSTWPPSLPRSHAMPNRGSREPRVRRLLPLRRTPSTSGHRARRSRRCGADASLVT